MEINRILRIWLFINGLLILNSLSSAIALIFNIFVGSEWLVINCSGSLNVVNIIVLIIKVGISIGNRVILI